MSACLHCGLPVPVSEPDASFCCNGCRAVHEILKAEGLDRFYQLGGAVGQPVGSVPSKSDREWIGDLEARALADGGAAASCRISVDVQGIHCAACVWLLQELWRRTPGALRLDLNPASGRAEVTYDPAAGTLTRYVGEIERLGYRMGPAGAPQARPERGLLIRTGICIALALNAMMFALAGYFGMSEADGPAYALFRWLAFALSTAAVAIGGPVFFRAAFVGLRRRVLHLDLPISLGIALAWGSSAYLFLAGEFAGQTVGDSYFDTVTVFVALMLLGRYLQRAAVRRNRDYLLAHHGAEHVKARRLREAGVERVAAVDLRAGDELLLAPGDLVPADAILSSAEAAGGEAAFSLDWISGESRPRVFAAAEEIPAGAFAAGRQPVRVLLLRTAEQSGLLRLLATPVRSEADGSDCEDGLRGRGRFWELLNRGYVAAVLSVATLVGLVWALVDPSRAVSVTTAVLVVTCPCALGLATPLAFDMAVAALRRAGVFVRNPSLLEKARHVRRIVFDKTGTLTWGGVQVESLREPEASSPRGELLRDVAFTMASSSSHPVSVAIAARLGARGARFLDAVEVEEHVGRGLAARHQGAEYRLGSQSFTVGDRDLGGDHGICVFTADGHAEAVFAVREDYRSGAAEEIRALEADGHEVLLVSGDRPDRVARAAAELGIAAERAHGGVDPEGKAELIRGLDHDDTLMVGDGLNDAPAFEAAYCAGTPALDRPVMPSRADFFYTGLGTGAVRRVLRQARRFHGVVRVNLALAIAYNALAVTLAALGMMTPLLCAVLMPISSLVLIAHTATALKFIHIDREDGAV